MVLVIICASLPEIRDSLKDSLAPILEEEFGDMFGSGADSASYKLMAGDVLEVGENVDGGIVPGYYIASCSKGFVSFMIMGEEGENGSNVISWDNASIHIFSNLQHISCHQFIRG